LSLPIAFIGLMSARISVAARPAAVAGCQARRDVMSERAS
jgi:hypothetical protein